MSLDSGKINVHLDKNASSDSAFFSDTSALQTPAQQFDFPNFCEKSNCDGIPEPKKRKIRRKLFSGTENQENYPVFHIELPTLPNSSSTPKSKFHSTTSPSVETKITSTLKCTPVCEGTKDTPLSSRRLTPLSERQQIALLLQLTAPENQSGSFSPATPRNITENCKVKKKTHKKSHLYKQNEKGETPLHIAAKRGDVRKVRFLIRQGADINIKDFAGWSPLHEACNHGWYDIVRTLVNAGADVNASGFGGDTPLHDAAVNSHYKIVEFLVHHGASLLQKNAKCKTPVDVARSDDTKLFLKEHVSTPRRCGNTCGVRLFAVSAASKTTSTLTSKAGSELCSPTMRKNLPHNQTQKGAEKPTSPRLTLRFQSIKPRDDKNPNCAKAQELSSVHPRYQSYCVTMEARGDVYEFDKDDTSVSSSHVVTSATDNDNQDQKLDIVTSSSKDAEASVEKECKKSEAEASIVDEVRQENPELELMGNQKVGGGRGNVHDSANAEYEFNSDEDKEETKRKRRKSSDNTNLSKLVVSSHVGLQKQRGHGVKTSFQEGLCEQQSPKTRKIGGGSSSDTESTQSDGDNEAEQKYPASEPLPAIPRNMNISPPVGPHSPKVPPLKIVLPSGSGGLENDHKERSKVSSSKQALPYIVNTSSEGGESNSPESTSGSTQPESATKENGMNYKVESSTSKGKEEEEKCHRVTRSSQRMQAAQSNVSSTQNQNLEASCHSSVASTSTQKSEASGETSPDEQGQHTQVDVHPRKRKLRHRDGPSDLSNQQPSGSAPNLQDDQQSHQMLNSYEMYLNIRKQVDKRRKGMMVVYPKPPQGYKDYLINRCSYVLEGNAASRLSVPMIPPPQSLSGSMKELFVHQEKERYKLRLQHLIEREKLVLSAEQEILRVHGRAARAMVNQSVPLSVCSVLKDEEIYNVLDSEHEDKDKHVRSRYNGRLFLSWLQDVDDKWEKIKENMLLRHHNEAESLHAVQKLDWEWKMKELAMCDVKACPVIDDIYVPMVHVSDDFDVLPA
ncbi:ankyrin repeat domain-containing protein 12-like [Limulus polyphemus]|uniref:Ankyrin repeat domain-containing protein 12-like n=1 Tax=Limulus polyphemus TaxID=6850 RepID=A0ABM1T6L4_LIMPO|nr:ankyrin repeat domain-containing protein 12-like [Limulus polyphemus]